MKRSLLAFSVTLLIGVSACGGGGSTAPANNTGGTGSMGGTGGTGGTTTVPPNTVIARAGDSFDPSSLTVAVGTTVSFTFESTGHNVTFDVVGGRPADIGGSNTNTTITRQFTQTGSFGYQCTLHPGMRGTVLVQ